MERLKRKIQKSMKQHGFVGTLKLCAKNMVHCVSSKITTRNGMEFDLAHGTDTSGIIELSDLAIENPMWEYGIRYQPTPPSILKDALGSLMIDFKDFVFIDLGSGKGRTLLLASEHPFKKIIGVEISEELSEIAARNISAFKSDVQQCRDLESVCDNAAEYDLPDEKLVLYLYNPFTEKVMAEVLKNIQASLEASPREVYIVYYNPVASHLLDRADGLERVRSLPKYLVFKSVRG
jgi:SAM-dependent methyltransferase